MSENVSVVVPFSGRERVESLMLCLDAIREQLDGRDEVVVVEQEFDPRDVCGRAVAKNRGARHERLTRAGRFNRSACVNRGVDAAANKLVLVSDCDCIKAPDCLERLRIRVQPGQAVWGWIGRLGRVPTLAVLEAGNVEDFETAWRLSVPEPRGWGDAAGFMRCDWRKAGRYCEEFEGWAGEDWDFVESLRASEIRVLRDPSLRSLHLWHEAPEGQQQDAACNCKILDARRAERAKRGFNETLR